MNEAAIAPGAAARLEPPPARIVVKQVNWLGDLVISLPALRAIRRAWPCAHLAVLIKAELAGFFDGAREIDEVIAYRAGRGIAGLGDRLRIVAELRARRFDLGVLFPGSFESALWLAMARIPRRAGFVADARGPMLTHKATPPRVTSGEHQVRHWLTMVRATLGVEGDENDFALEADEKHRASMREWLAANRRRAGTPLYALAPAAAYGPAKEWPAARFAQLIDVLAAQEGAECVLVGAPAERVRCEQVAALSRAGAIVAAGRTGIGELIALLSLSDGFVGNDSGAAHLAGALGVPTVAIFGSTDPVRTGQRGAATRIVQRKLECSPCLARTCRFGHYNCLRQIEPAEITRVLAQARARRDDRAAAIE